MIAFSDIFTFSRASTKWVQDAAGSLVEVAVDEPAFDYATGKRALLLEGQSTNTVSNSMATGAVAGILGGTGVLPSHWSVSTPDASWEVVGFGAENGVDYVDIRLNGNINGDRLINLNGGNVIPVGGEVPITWSVYLAIVGGDTSNIASFLARTTYRDGGGYSGKSNKGVTLTSTLTRYSFETTTPAGTTGVLPDLEINDAIGDVDVTLRVGLPQLETQSVTTSPIKTSGTAVTRAADICYAENLVGVESGYSIVFSGHLGGVQDRFDRLFQLDNNDNDNRQLLFWQTSVNELRIQLFVDNVNQAASTLGGVRTLGVDFRAAYRVGVNDFQAAADGVAYDASDTLGYTVPTFMALAAADAVGTAKPASLSIYSIEILDTLLTEAELIEVTS